MLGKFWESVGTDLGKKWLEKIFGPAFLFWLGGAGAYLLADGAANIENRWDPAWAWINAQQPMVQGALVLGALLVLVLSSTLMEHFRYMLLRLLEGYWPKPLHRLVVWVGQTRAKRLWKDELAWQALKGKEEKLTPGQQLSPYEEHQLSQLEMKLHYTPSDPRHTMVSGLGDILRAGEGTPAEKYGLDAVVCWPRLWLVMPELARTELTNARQSLDQRVELWGWGLLFLVWSFWSIWAVPVAILWLMFAYSLCKQTAKGYADLIEAAFDLYRWDLYKAVRLPVPELAVQEKNMGKQLTEYLWRGMDKGISYQHPKEE